MGGNVKAIRENAIKLLGLIVLKIDLLRFSVLSSLKLLSKSVCKINTYAAGFMQLPAIASNLSKIGSVFFAGKPVIKSVYVLFVLGSICLLGSKLVYLLTEHWQTFFYSSISLIAWGLPVLLGRVTHKSKKQESTAGNTGDESTPAETKPGASPGPIPVKSNPAEDKTLALDELLEQMVKRRTAELTQANEKLEQRNALFESILNVPGMGTWEIDLETQQLHWSPSMYKMHDVETGTSITLEDGINFYHPDHRAIIKRAINNGIQNAEKYDLESILVTQKGRHVWVNTVGHPVIEDGKITKIRGLLRDIDEKKRLQQKTEDQVQLLSSAIDAGEIGIWNWNIADDSMYWNEYMHKHLDWPKEKFKGRYEDLIERLSQHDRDRVESAIQRSMDSPGWHNVKYEIACEDGSVKNITSKGIVVTNFIGSPEKIIGVCLDASKEKEGEAPAQDTAQQKKKEEERDILNKTLQKEVKERTKQLEAINKELEAFNYSVSHDLRSPLRVIKGFTQILMTDYYETLDPGAANYVERIFHSTNRMSDLVDSLLQLSHISQREVLRQRIDLTSLYRQAIEENKLGEKYTINIQDGLGTLGDLQMVKVLVKNLVNNAIKYSSKIDHPRIEMGSCVHQTGDCFYIKDNGVGFDIKYADRLFGAFQRLHSKQEFEGMGIGLAVVKRIINKHGGSIRAESKPGRGATFYFTLNHS